MSLIDKETIRAELERSKVSFTDFEDDFTRGAMLCRNATICALLNFLDTLPEQPVEKKSNALFDKCVENCDPTVMKEVSDNIDRMLGRQPVEGLEEEISSYIESHYHIRYDETLERGSSPLTTFDFGDIARHFYELGCRRAAVMYDDIEYNRQRAEEAEISKGLEEEIERYCGPYNKRPVPDFIDAVARHFAEWGKNNLK